MTAPPPHPFHHSFGPLCKRPPCARNRSRPLDQVQRTLRWPTSGDRLCEHLAGRVARERTLGEDGGGNRLGQADIAAVAAAVLPLALQGLYSKSSTATLQSCTALRHLGFLDPATTLPPLLARVYGALTTLTEVHQTSSALEVLAAVRRPLPKLYPLSANTKPQAPNTQPRLPNPK